MTFKGMTEDGYQLSTLGNNLRLIMSLEYGISTRKKREIPKKMFSCFRIQTDGAKIKKSSPFRKTGSPFRETGSTFGRLGPPFERAMNPPFFWGGRGDFLEFFGDFLGFFWDFFWDFLGIFRDFWDSFGILLTCQRTSFESGHFYDNFWDLWGILMGYFRSIK